MKVKTPKFSLFAVFLLALIFVFAVFAPPVSAQELQVISVFAQEEAPTFWALLREAGEALKGMIFVGLFCSSFVGYLKSKGKVKDDDVMTMLTGMSATLILIFAVIKFFVPEFNLLVFEDYAKLVVDSSGAWTPIALLIINIFSKIFYTNVLRGLPIIGFSFSKQKEKFDPPLGVKLTK